MRQFIAGLGYAVHTPGSVFGRARLEEGLYDEDWLPVAGREGWAVIGRDQRILDRPLELQAYFQAKVHMFLLPGEAKREAILTLVGANLAAICTAAVALQPNVYWMTAHGLVKYEIREARRERARLSRRARLT